MATPQHNRKGALCIYVVSFRFFPSLSLPFLSIRFLQDKGRQDHSLTLLVAVPELFSPKRSFNSLGVKLSKPEDDESIEKLALVMFDTRTMKVSAHQAVPSFSELRLVGLPLPA